MGELTQNGFETSGTTANKPTNVEEGQPYFDETLATWQVYDGSNWLSVITATSAGVYSLLDGESIVLGADSDLTLATSAGFGIIDGAAGINIGPTVATAVNIGRSGQTVGFFGVTAVEKQAAIADATDTSATDQKAPINAIIDVLEAFGLIIAS